MSASLVYKFCSGSRTGVRARPHTHLSPGAMVQNRNTSVPVPTFPQVPWYRTGVRASPYPPFPRFHGTEQEYERPHTHLSPGSMVQPKLCLQGFPWKRWQLQELLMEKGHVSLELKHKQFFLSKFDLFNKHIQT
jgi:hypothetical protein